MPYSSYDHDKLETAETMRIERRIYFEAKDGDIAPYVSLAAGAATRHARGKRGGGTGDF